METVENLSEETIERLRHLIRINRDSARGCREAAELLEEGPIRDFFAALCEERSIQARILRGFLRINGEEVPESEASSVPRRYWRDLDTALSARDAAAILAEAKRGERRLRQLYEEMLVDTAGSPLNDVLQRQYLQSQVGLRRVQELHQVATEA